jgi:CHRD domain-containing protein
MKKTTISKKTLLSFTVVSLSLIIAVIFITSLSSTTTSVFAAQQKFTAKLSGDQQVPPIQTSASGIAWFKPMQDNIWFKVNVTDIQGVTMAHIHSGKQGENGPPVVPLYKSETPSGQMSGVLAKGNITADTFQGPMAGKQISDLITAMQNGETYVNIHTQQNPDGEIRGQIMMSNSTTMMK